MRSVTVLNVFVVCHISWTGIKALRDTGVKAPGSREQECLHAARPSDRSEFDFHSLVFDEPQFTYLEAQEFFTSAESNCRAPLDDVEAMHVPRDLKAKQLQLQQRFVVKHIEESLKKRDASNSSGVGKMLFAKVDLDKSDRVPAVELHMFPKDLRDINSPWSILLIPRAREIYGRKVFLCRRHASLPCVAELQFEPLPPRLMHLMNKWSPSLDSSRSAPRMLLLSMDLLLVAAALLVLWQLLDSLREIVRTAWALYKSPKDDTPKEKLLQMVLPKTFTLTQHAFVYKAEGGDARLEERPLEACSDVQVLKMVEASRLTDSFTAKIDQLLFHRGESAVWGQLESGWILCLDGADLRIIPKGESLPVPWCANASLLAPFSNLLRRQLVLAASHCSGQWLLVARCVKSLALAEVLAMSVGFFLVHAATLVHMQVTNARALVYEEVLEREGKLLQLASQKRLQMVFVGALVLVVLAMAAGVWQSRLSAIWPCSSLTVALALHAFDFYLSHDALTKWRSPQLRASEFTALNSGGLSISADSQGDVLSKERYLHKQMVKVQIWLLVMGALSLLMFIVLDGVQMRGELVDYSLSRGYTATPPHADTVQNTVVLHTNIDSVTFSFAPGPYTSKVQLQLLHPLADSNDSKASFDAEDVDGNKGALTLSLPRGPLYSRLIIEAWSHLHREPTLYMFHLLRVGDAMSISMNATVNPDRFEKEQLPVHFHEERRWSHQAQHPEWYVPDLDMSANGSVRLVHLPVVFAPLLQYDSRARFANWQGMTLVASTCRCDPERPGFGNSCSKEQQVNLRGADLCLFQHVAAADLLTEDYGAGSVCRNSRELASWLSDVNVSGKSAALRLDVTASRDSTSVLPLEPAETPHSSNRTFIGSVFETFLPIPVLSQATQLAVATTQDMTDAEQLVVRFKVVSHPPPIQLRINSGFFLPETIPGEEQPNHAACGVSDLGEVSAEVYDPRFRVEDKVVSKGLDCDGHSTLRQKHFKVVRLPDSSCAPYCSSYNPWAPPHDASVTLSVSRCLDEAILLGKVDTFGKIRESLKSGAKVVFAGCHTLRKAVKLNQSHIAKDILESKQASPNGAAEDDESPLQVAAADGNVAFINLLLQGNATLDWSNKDGRTALVAAVQNCRLEAVQALLSRSRNPKMLTNQLVSLDESGCRVNSLLALVGSRPSPCREGNLTDSIIKELHQRGAALSLPVQPKCKMRQTALMMALDRGEISVVKQLLELRADPNEEGRRFSGFQQKPFEFVFEKMSSHVPATVIKFKKFAELLVAKGADVDVKIHGVTPLMKAAAEECKADLVEILVGLGADPSKRSDEENKTAEELFQEVLADLEDDEEACPKESASKIKRLLHHSG